MQLLFRVDIHKIKFCSTKYYFTFFSSSSSSSSQFVDALVYAMKHKKHIQCSKPVNHCGTNGFFFFHSCVLTTDIHWTLCAHPIYSWHILFSLAVGHFSVLFLLLFFALYFHLLAFVNGIHLIHGMKCLHLFVLLFLLFAHKMLTMNVFIFLCVFTRLSFYLIAISTIHIFFAASLLYLPERKRRKKISIYQNCASVECGCMDVCMRGEHKTCRYVKWKLCQMVQVFGHFACKLSSGNKFYGYGDKKRMNIHCGGGKKVPHQHLPFPFDKEMNVGVWCTFQTWIFSIIHTLEERRSWCAAKECKQWQLCDVVYMFNVGGCYLRKTTKNWIASINLSNVCDMRVCVCAWDTERKWLETLGQMFSFATIATCLDDVRYSRKIELNQPSWTTKSNTHKHKHTDKRTQMECA